MNRCITARRTDVLLFIEQTYYCSSNRRITVHRTDVLLLIEHKQPYPLISLRLLCPQQRCHVTQPLQKLFDGGLGVF